MIDLFIPDDDGRDGFLEPRDQIDDIPNPPVQPQKHQRPLLRKLFRKKIVLGSSRSRSTHSTDQGCCQWQAQTVARGRKEGTLS